jgi:4,5-DOPA dioxygenase extradiol
VTPQKIPAAYIGHSGPAGAFKRTSVTRAWRAYGASIPRPRALLVISGHWYVRPLLATAAERPQTLHDFCGGPPEAWAFQYPAPGDPALVERVAELAQPIPLDPDYDSWGIDHGSWTVLAHMYPQADIPVVQLSVSSSLSFQDHVDLGARLAPLRDDGVLILGSGNILHNRLVYPEYGGRPEELDVALDFHAAVHDVMMSEPGLAAKLGEHPGYRISAPTDDHFIPLLYFAGVASVADEQVVQLIDGPAHGVFGGTAYALA